MFVGGAFIYCRGRKFEVVENFYYKFIYWFVESRNKDFILDLKTSLYYSELLLRKVSP